MRPLDVTCLILRAQIALLNRVLQELGCTPDTKTLHGPARVAVQVR